MSIILIKVRKKHKSYPPVKCNKVSSRGQQWVRVLAYLVALPPGGCLCLPATRWQCRTRRWAAAQTAGRSAASHQPPQGSGRCRRRRVAHAGSRRTAPGSGPGGTNNRAISNRWAWPQEYHPVMFPCLMSEAKWCCAWLLPKLVLVGH